MSKDASTIARQVIAEGIERRALRAKRSLGLPYSWSELDETCQNLRDQSPLYVHSVRITGVVWNDVYDDHPGVAHFNTDASVSLDLEGYYGLEQAKTIAQQRFDELVAEAKAGRDECGDVYDGLFEPRGIVLTDQYDGPVAEHDGKQWVTDIPEHQEWESLLGKAGELHREARQQSGWDNFHTARSLDNQAAAMERRVAMAQRRGRLIEGVLASCPNIQEMGGGTDAEEEAYADEALEP